MQASYGPAWRTEPWVRALELWGARGWVLCRGLYGNKEEGGREMGDQRFFGGRGQVLYWVVLPEADRKGRKSLWTSVDNWLSFHYYSPKEPFQTFSPKSFLPSHVRFLKMLHICLHTACTAWIFVVYMLEEWVFFFFPRTKGQYCLLLKVCTPGEKPQGSRWLEILTLLANQWAYNEQLIIICKVNECINKCHHQQEELGQDVSKIAEVNEAMQGFALICK